jgi:hypothetical protein
MRERFLQLLGRLASFLLGFDLLFQILAGAVEPYGEGLPGLGVGRELVRRAEAGIQEDLENPQVGILVLAKT